MSNTKLIVAGVMGVVALTGLVTARWWHGKMCQNVAHDATTDLLKNDPELVVKMMKSRLKRLQDEGAAEHDIDIAQLALSNAEANLAARNLERTQATAEHAEQNLAASMNKLRTAADGAAN